MKIITSLALALLLSQNVAAQQASDELIPAPENEEPTVFYLNDKLILGGTEAFTRNFREEKIFFLDDNQVLVREFLDYGAYLKGTLDKTAGTITIENGQPALQVQSGFGSPVVTYYFAELDPNTGQPKTGAFTLNYEDKGNGNFSVSAEDLQYALYNNDNGQLAIYKQGRVPQFTSKKDIDSKAFTVKYECDDKIYGSGRLTNDLTAVFHNGTLYLHNFDPILEGTWVSAQIRYNADGMSLFIPSCQYLASYTNTEHFILYAGSSNDGSSIDTTSYDGLSLPTTLSEDGQTYKCVSKASDAIGAGDYFSDGRGLQEEFGTIYQNLSISLPASVITTGITSVTTKTTNGDNAYYDLQGRKYSKPTHGVFIHNGRKVVIR
ncbi:MAG: hypothetical protein K6A82_00325 [Prevotella sp.]|nr:hypothetical protein [Prevotella sp.]